MKAAVVFLVLLGLLAAVSAAVLVQTLAYKPTDQAQRVIDEVEVMVASRDLPALTVVQGDAVSRKMIKKAELPESALTNSVQVVGKVLASAMVEGEMFRPTVFAKEGSGVHMAAALPQGKRAMSVSLADWSSMAGLLYPGSVVDVLFSAKRARGSNDATSLTLLQGVQVLAIGSQSVTSDQFQDRNPGAMSTKGQINQRMVTLMVDLKEAQVLQLAQQYGNITLTMRNPLDVNREARRETKTSELLGGYASAAPGALEALLKALTKPQPPEEGAEQASAKLGERPALRSRQLWEMLIIRGGISETKTFPMPTDNTAGKVGQATQGGEAVNGSAGQAKASAD